MRDANLPPSITPLFWWKERGKIGHFYFYETLEILKDTRGTLAALLVQKKSNIQKKL